MRRSWKESVTNLVLAALGLALFGWMIGVGTRLLLVGLLGYLAWSTYQMVRLHRWLEGKTGSEPPESHGMWGTIFDGINDLQRKQKKSRKRLRKVLRRVQSSLGALRDGVVMIDSNRCLEWWNEAASRLLGLRERQDRGQLITNLLREPAFIEYFHKGDFSEPLEFRSPANRSIVLLAQITKYGKNDFLMLVRDVSRIHQLEQVRRDFVANVSHELKTPLTVIRGYLETLLEANSGMPERTADCLEAMESQALRMHTLIDDLLYLSRLENPAGSAQPEPVPLRPLLDRICRDIRPLATGKGQAIELDIENDFSLMGYEGELYSAFSNLAMNSVRYTGNGGQIQIRVCGNQDALLVEFRDNGIGIEFEHLRRLTERFYRVDKSRSVASGGTGLGLAIVKHVLLRHDADLAIESEPDVGSTFTCRFPKSRVAQLAAPDTAA